MLAKQKNQAMRGSGGTYGSMTKRFDGKEDPKVRSPLHGVITLEKRPTDISKQDAVLPISTGNAEEDAKIQDFFAQQGQQWEQTQEGMAMSVTEPAWMSIGQASEQR